MKERKAVEYTDRTQRDSGGTFTDQEGRGLGFVSALCVEASSQGNERKRLVLRFALTLSFLREKREVSITCGKEGELGIPKVDIFTFFLLTILG